MTTKTHATLRQDNFRITCTTVINCTIVAIAIPTSDRYGQLPDSIREIMTFRKSCIIQEFIKKKIEEVFFIVNQIIVKYIYKLIIILGSIRISLLLKLKC